MQRRKSGRSISPRIQPYFAHGACQANRYGRFGFHVLADKPLRKRLRPGYSSLYVDQSPAKP
jgi:hypothetical protein